jgi:hypothetical protein
VPENSTLKKSSSPDNSSIKLPGFQRIFRLNEKNNGISLAKNFPSEESSGEKKSASRDFFRAKNYPAKNTPSKESSRRRIFRPNKKLTVAKNSPAKNHPSEELSGEELSGEEFS